MKRAPLRRLGSVGRRYLLARDLFLASFIAQKVAGAEGAAIGCQCDEETCWRRVRVWAERGTMMTDGHVHHVKKRSMHPELRNDPHNLRLVHSRCHQRMHA